MKRDKGKKKEKNLSSDPWSTISSAWKLVVITVRDCLLRPELFPVSVLDGFDPDSPRWAPPAALQRHRQHPRLDRQLEGILGLRLKQMLVLDVVYHPEKKKRNE